MRKTPAPDALPSEEAISREEEAILWQSLDRIPDTYREPLILFYREHRSVQAVARALDITEDAAKQRLSRGRRLLSQAVAALVEGALERSTPGKAFTIGVMAALPVMVTSASAATLGATVAKGTTAAKAAAVSGLLGAIVGPIIGILGGWFGVKASLASATSERERRLIVRFTWIVVGLVVTTLLVMSAFTTFGREWSQERPVLATSLLIGFSLFYVMGLLGLILRFNVLQRRTRRTDLAAVGGSRNAVGSIPAVRTLEYRSRWTFLGVPLVHVLIGRRPEDSPRPALGWIAVGDVSIGIVLSFGGITVGGISIGLLAFGGFALGPVAGGGLAIGFWAVGGMALGYLALGGCAMAWHAALGGLAVARHIAVGGSAVALHANDEAARSFIEGHPFFQHGIESLGHANGFVLLCLAPLGVIVWHTVQARKRLSQRGTPAR